MPAGVFRQYIYNLCHCSDTLEPCKSQTIAPGACFANKFVYSTQAVRDMHKTTELYQQEFGEQGDPAVVLRHEKLDQRFSECENMPVNRKAGCFYGFGAALAEFNSPPYLNQYCGGLELDEEIWQSCIDGCVSRISGYHPELVQAFCATLPPHSERSGFCQQIGMGGLFNMQKDMSKYLVSDEG